MKHLGINGLLTDNIRICSNEFKVHSHEKWYTCVENLREFTNESNERQKKRERIDVSKPKNDEKIKETK